MSNKFVTESQIEEQKRQRQEQWDKTRKEGDPLEPPEEVYDPRTLYERLREQKEKKQEEFEESRKLKNLIKGLDNDEVEFLNEIDNSRAEAESQKYREELIAIEEYKRQMSETNADDQDRKLLDFKRELFRAHKDKTSGTKTNISDKKKSQAALIQGAIKRKGPSGSTNEKKVKHEENKTTSEAAAQPPKFDPSIPTQYCIGFLPGLGCYDDNSDSCDSDRESDESHDDLEHFQVFGTPVANCSKDKGNGGSKCKQ